MTHPITTDTQRERLLAHWEALQAEEGAPDYVALTPTALEPPRRPTFREWLALTINRAVLYECWTGLPATPGHTCRECEGRAAQRHLRFWLTVTGTGCTALMLYGLWVWRPQ
jgi:hypothetical protein